MDAATENKLLAMLDRHEIWQVVQKYGRALDRLDVELARSMYWEDATDDHGGFVGDREAFIEYANGTTKMAIGTSHALMNHYCELAGDDAYTETYYMFTGFFEEGPHLMSIGRYVDHFQKRNGEWRIKNRVCTIEKTYGLDDNPRFQTVPAALATGDVQPVRRDRDDVAYHRPLKPRAHRSPDHGA